jgi:membrane fusion protein, heavy metal efflux system
MTDAIGLASRSWVLILVAITLAGCGDSPATGDHDAHAAATEDFERGPHNGRMLRDGDFALEITIFESGVPPEFRVYPYRDGQPVAPETVDLTIELGRLGDRIDTFSFRPESDYLRGDGVVLEPHSFDVRVKANVDGRQSSWEYESFEGRTSIDTEVAEAMGIEVETAGDAVIHEVLTTQGVLAPARDAVSEVRGRYPGIVQSLEKDIGDAVKSGERLATLQSNESLQSYGVTAPRSGTVIARQGVVGGAAGEAPLYVIADLSRLVAELKIYAADLGKVAEGQAVVVSGLEGETSYAGTVSRILPTLQSSSRTATALVYIDPVPKGWRPGIFVQGRITVNEVAVPLAVKKSGLQSFRDFTVVYARVGDTYEVRMLELGRSDAEYIEVLGGLEPGTTYVTGNSYLVKADIEKSGASHDH